MVTSLMYFEVYIMENAIIVIILIVILIPAISVAAKHMRGEGDCCGGPKEKPIKKKMDGKPIRKIRLTIDGMMCNNCRVRVENGLNAMDGVLAKVSLADKEAKVSLYKEISDEEIIAAVEALDYKANIK
jgi:copper chaperone